jgi:hypothetical protein
MMLKNMSHVSKSKSKGDSSMLNESEDFFSCSSSQDNLSEGANTSNMPVNSTKINDTLGLVSSEIKHVWQMVVESSKSSPESLGLFEDNLSSILLKDNSIQSEYVETLIKDNLKQMTSGLFKLNPNEHTRLAKLHRDKLSNFRIELDFGLDSIATGSLNLLTIQMSDAQKKNFHFLNGEGESTNGLTMISPIAIASTFRLFASLERNNLLALKDYIGLPILTIKKDDIYKFGNLSSNESSNDTSLTSSFDVTSLSK